MPTRHCREGRAASFEAAAGHSRRLFTHASSATPASHRSPACLRPPLSRGPALVPFRPSSLARRRSLLVRAWPDGAGRLPVHPLDGFDSAFDAMEQEMTEMQRRMDGEMERMMRDSRDFQRQAEKKLLKSEDTIMIERSEQRGGDSYSKSVIIISGPGLQVARTEPSVASWLGVFLAAVVACGYAVCTYLFNRNFESTTFKDESRMRLSVLWPLLLVISPRFRKQFREAFRARTTPEGGTPTRPEREFECS